MAIPLQDSDSAVELPIAAEQAGLPQPYSESESTESKSTESKSTESKSTESKSTESESTESESTESESQNGLEGSTRSSIQINTKRKVRRRRLPILPIMATILFVAGIGGAIYFAMNYEALLAAKRAENVKSDPTPTPRDKFTTCQPKPDVGTTRRPFGPRDGNAYIRSTFLRPREQL